METRLGELVAERTATAKRVAAGRAANGQAGPTATAAAKAAAAALAEFYSRAAPVVALAHGTLVRPPPLVEAEIGPAATALGFVRPEDRSDEESALWGDQATRVFYESVADVTLTAPGLGLVRTERAARETDAADLLEGGADDQDQARTPTADDVEQGAESPRDDASTPDDAARGAAFSRFLLKMQEPNGAEAVDRLAADFCYLDSKGNRRRLAKLVLDADRMRPDLLPMYCRLRSILPARLRAH